MRIPDLTKQKEGMRYRDQESRASKRTSSLYFMIVRFLALVSTQVTKSSICLVTSIVGSVIGEGPTRT